MFKYQGKTSCFDIYRSLYLHIQEVTKNSEIPPKKTCLVCMLKEETNNIKSVLFTGVTRGTKKEIQRGCDWRQVQSTTEGTAIDSSGRVSNKPMHGSSNCKGLASGLVQLAQMFAFMHFPACYCTAWETRTSRQHEDNPARDTPTAFSNSIPTSKLPGLSSSCRALSISIFIEETVFSITAATEW